MRILQEDNVQPTYAVPELELLIESSIGPVMSGAGGGISRALASPVFAVLFFVVRLPMAFQHSQNHFSSM